MKGGIILLGYLINSKSNCRKNIGNLKFLMQTLDTDI